MEGFVGIPRFLGFISTLALPGIMLVGYMHASLIQRVVPVVLYMLFHGFNEGTAAWIRHKVQPPMSDRYGAYRTPRAAVPLQIRGKIDDKEFTKAKDWVGERFPALIPTLEKIVQGYYASPASLPGAVTLRAHPNSSDQWDFFAEQSYKTLGPEIRQLQ